MKILLLSLFLLGLITVRSSYAMDTAPEERSTDTLVYLGGRLMPVHMVNITSSRVYFTGMDDNEIIEVDRKQVEKIIYSNGKIEVLNHPVFEIASDDDWRHVFLTEDPADVEDLYEIGPVEVMAAAGRNMKSTMRNAEIRLKKQAAGLKANMILVTNTEFRGGYRDIPSITINGTAYGSVQPSSE